VLTDAQNYVKSQRYQMDLRRVPLGVFEGTSGSIEYLIDAARILPDSASQWRPSSTIRLD